MGEIRTLLALVLAQVPDPGSFPVGEIVGATTLAALAFAAVVRVIYVTMQDRNQQKVVDAYETLADKYKAEAEEERSKRVAVEVQLGIVQVKLREAMERGDLYHARLEKAGLLLPGEIHEQD